jgi:hypothetical protein
VEELRKQLESRYACPDLMGRSEGMQRLFPMELSAGEVV